MSLQPHVRLTLIHLGDQLTKQTDQSTLCARIIRLQIDLVKTQSQCGIRVSYGCIELSQLQKDVPVK